MAIGIGTSIASYANTLADDHGTKMVDAFLVGMNAFNAFVLFTHLHPVESPLKKPIVDVKHRIVSKAHSTPFLVASILAMLLSITTYSAIQYSVSSTIDSATLVRAIVSAYAFVVTAVFVNLSNTMIKLSVDRVLDIEREVVRRDIVKFEPPSKRTMDAIVAPYRPFFAVESVGLDRIPKDRPHLFVSNHSLYGLEMPMFLNELYQKRGVFPRGLADHFHFATPNGPILRKFGAVDGTRDNVDALMGAGYEVLVYPGGGHEVLKSSKVPRYELMWKQRVGFARCAIKHGYPILPCACIGVEDMFDPIGDIPVHPSIIGAKGYVIPVTVISPCRVQKIYFWFGDPIPTKQYDGDFTNDDFAKEVRDKTKAAIEAGIRELRERQGSDPERFLVDRCASKIRRYFGSSVRKGGAMPSVEEEAASEYDDSDDFVGALTFSYAAK